MLGFVVTSLLASGCAKPVTHSFVGTVTIRQQPARSRGTSCRGGGADADIAAGATVVVTDDKHEVVARTTLGRGTVVTYPGTGVAYAECRFGFRVTIPDRPAYAVRIADRTAIPRAHEAMEQDGWTLDVAFPLPPAITP